MTVHQRESLFCCVRLLIVHLGSLGYFKLPFADAVRERNFDLNNAEFGERPVFCKLSMRHGKGMIMVRYLT